MKEENEIKVGNVILFDGENRKVSVVNGDKTFRLFNENETDDEGCFSPNDNRIGVDRTAINMIHAERRRQIERLGYMPSMDIRYFDGQLSKAASAYAMPPEERVVFGGIPDAWPEDWKEESWKPESRIRELVKAGALICAEIDRLKSMEDYIYCINQYPSSYPKKLRETYNVVYDNGTFGKAMFVIVDGETAFCSEEGVENDVIAWKYSE